MAQHIHPTSPSGCRFASAIITPDSRRTEGMIEKGGPVNDLSTLRTGLGSSFSAIEDLTSTLGAAEWPAQSLCPAWTVRDVVSHLASVEVVLSGWLPDGVDVPPPFERAGSFVASTSGLDAASFVPTVHEVFRRASPRSGRVVRARSAASVVDADW